MNERVKELWKQSQTRQEVETFTEGIFCTRVTDNYEKFAELIVQKFDDILMLEYLDCVGDKDNQAKERIQRLRKKVSTYFGINNEPQ